MIPRMTRSLAAAALCLVAYAATAADIATTGSISNHILGLIPYNHTNFTPLAMLCRLRGCGVAVRTIFLELLIRALAQGAFDSLTQVVVLTLRPWLRRGQAR